MSNDRFPTWVVRMPTCGSERISSQEKPLAFIHINKTAGTSLMQYLKGHFESPAVVAPPWYGDFDEIGVDDVTRQMFWGHFTYEQFVKRRPDAWFITFLRDPVQRVVSQYRSLHNPANLRDGWEKVLPNHARRAMDFAQSASFEEFVMSEDPFIVGHIRNLQTRFLSSYGDQNHPEYLSSAIRNLTESILFFGVTESFQDSISLFRYQLQSSRPYIAEEHDRNVSQPYDVSVTSTEVRHRLHQLVGFDQQLYELAVTEFSRRVQCMKREIEGNNHEAA